MKNSEDYIRLDKLIENDTESLKSIVNLLNEILEKKELSEDVIKTIDNASSEINILKNRFLWRYVNALKQGYSN